MNRLILAGSPRTTGRSEHLAEQLFEACIEDCPSDEVTLAPVAELSIAPCKGCNACEKTENHTCIIKDDMTDVLALIEDADEIVVVSPVFFSGAPGSFKALLDRLQPYFWTWEVGGKRKPATLHIVGEGGDPNGFEALISEVRSALAVAGFRLERILDWVGRIETDGTILGDAIEYPLPPLPGRHAAFDTSEN